MPHGVGGSHCLNHEGGREVGHEREHNDDSGTETVAGVAKRRWERQGPRAHDQVKDVGESGQRGVQRGSQTALRATPGTDPRHGECFRDPPYVRAAKKKFA